MTTDARFERQLPTLLEDLYLGPSPDYRDEVLAAASVRGSARRGPSQEGGSPWLTSQTGPDSCHACRGERSVWPSSSSRCSPSRPSRSSVRDRQDFRLDSGRRATDLSSTRAVATSTQWIREPG